MQFSCDRKELLAAAKRTAKAAPASSPVKGLTGILIRADAETYELSLAATNLEISITSTVAAPVLEGGSIVINALLFVNMLSLLDSQTIQVKTHPNGHIEIYGGDAYYLVAGLSAESFPPLPDVQQEDAVQIGSLKGLAKQTIFATAKSGNLAMQCVKLEIGQNTLRAIGCDGNILSSARREFKSGKAMQLLIPADSFSILAGLAGDEKDLLLSADGKQAVFRSTEQNWVFSARLGNGNYLDADAVLSGFVKQYEAIVDAADFRRALDGTSMASDTGSAVVHLVFSLGEISLSSKTEYGSAKDSVAAQVFTAMPEDGFYYQSKKLLQGIQSMSGQIRLSVSNTGLLLISTGEQAILQTSCRKPAPKAEKKPKADKKTKSKTTNTKTKAKAA